MTSRNESSFSASASAGEELPRVARALRILVADDDPDTALTLTMILRDEGYDARPVHSGRSVMSAVIREDLDAVILDIHMPDVSGWQVAQTIRARQQAKRPLLIGISGVYKTGADKALASVSGFDHYLVKPCAPADLIKLLEPLRNNSPAK
jgi:DNA-binding response OmpR family regulator